MKKGKGQKESKANEFKSGCWDVGSWPFKEVTVCSFFFCWFVHFYSSSSSSSCFPGKGKGGNPNHNHHHHNSCLNLLLLLSPASTLLFFTGFFFSLDYYTWCWRKWRGESFWALMVFWIGSWEFFSSCIALLLFPFLSFFQFEVLVMWYLFSSS